MTELCGCVELCCISQLCQNKVFSRCLRAQSKPGTSLVDGLVQGRGCCRIWHLDQILTPILGSLAPIQTAWIYAAKFSSADLSSTIWAAAVLHGGGGGIDSPCPRLCCSTTITPCWIWSWPAYSSTGLGLHP